MQENSSHFAELNTENTGNETKCLGAGGRSQVCSGGVGGPAGGPGQLSFMGEGQPRGWGQNCPGPQAHRSRATQGCSGPSVASVSPHVGAWSAQARHHVRRTHPAAWPCTQSPQSAEAADRLSGIGVTCGHLGIQLTLHLPWASERPSQSPAPAAATLIDPQWRVSPLELLALRTHAAAP